MNKRIFKPLALAAIVSGFIINAYATEPGFYMGLMGGPATNSGGEQQAQVQDSAATTPATPKSNQFGSRAFMGYKINRFAGFEGGITYFSGISYDTKDVETCSGATVRVRDFDLLARGYLPLGTSFNVFGKAGAAVVYQTTSGALNPSGTTECGKTTYETNYRPTASIGVSYDLSQNWEAEISWNRLEAGNAAGSIDFYAFGFSYHIVSTYCGQFLCD